MGRDIIGEAEEYWNSIRGARLMPARSDIVPEAIVRLLPNVILMDVAHNPLNFRYRLIGTEIDRHSAGNQTGKWITDIPGRAPPSKVWENLEAVIKERRPSTRSIPYVGRHRDFITSRQITMPLSSNGTDIDMLFLVIDYIKKQIGEARD